MSARGTASQRAEPRAGPQGSQPLCGGRCLGRAGPGPFSWASARVPAGSDHFFWASWRGMLPLMGCGLRQAMQPPSLSFPTCKIGK